jgi:hypothetical protein
VSSTVVLLWENCIDYRKLNDVRRKGPFSLPQVDDTLDTVVWAKWFSTLDLKSRYGQVDLHPDERRLRYRHGKEGETDHVSPAQLSEKKKWWYICRLFGT